MKNKGDKLMLNKEEREQAYWQGYIAKQNEAMEICKQCKYINKVKELESDKQKLIEKLEEDLKEHIDLIQEQYNQYSEYYARTGGYPNQMKQDVAKLSGEKNKIYEILKILKGEK